MRRRGLRYHPFDIDGLPLTKERNYTERLSLILRLLERGLDERGNGSYLHGGGLWMEIDN
jgi:hypothetical protein